MVRYSIAVCNYNMSDTIEKSLRSILDQIGHEYEVVVIDDGSSDRSINILTKLSAEYEQLRYVALDHDPNRNLGGTRQRAVEESAGEYVLVNMDADDVYEDGIEDFVHLYHRIEEVRREPFYLKGYGINMVPRDLLLEIPYRNVMRIDDKDLWRRLWANDAIVWFEHDPFWCEIGYHKTKWGSARNGFRRAVAEFQNGVRFWSYVRFHLTESIAPRYGNRRSGAYQTLIAPLAYYRSRSGEQYSLPEEFSTKGSLKQTIARKKCSGIAEIEDRFGIDIDRDEFGEIGQKAFFRDTPSFDDPKTLFDNPDRVLG
jgi:glycosyltransferase involved in cell wall biosynthesis